MSVVASTTAETINLNEIYKTLMQIVPVCGQIIRDAFYKEKSLKDKECFADFVTETDTKVENTLITFMKQKYPQHKY
jgi:myo-inositol-1(or 4)-monophosphatase